MNYYHIDKNLLSIIHGPVELQSTYIKKLTSCGNPECLNLSNYDIVPEEQPIKTEYQIYTGVPTVFVDKVVIGIRDMTQEEQADYIKRQNEPIKKHQDIESIMPSFSAVKDEIDAISNLSDAKAFLKRLSRIIYWNIKNTED